MPSDEVFEVFDADDRHVGFSTRGECHSLNGKIHRCSHILIVDDEGRILVAERSDLKDVSPGLYGCSVSGHPLPGETYREAAERELREELPGTEAHLEEVGWFRKYTRTDRENSMLYVARHSGPFAFNPEEIKSLEFMEPEKITQLMRERPSKFAPGFIKAFAIYRKRMLDG